MWYLGQTMFHKCNIKVNSDWKPFSLPLSNVSQNDKSSPDWLMTLRGVPRRCWGHRCANETQEVLRKGAEASAPLMLHLNYDWSRGGWVLRSGDTFSNYKSMAWTVWGFPKSWNRHFLTWKVFNWRMELVENLMPVPVIFNFFLWIYFYYSVLNFT